MKKCPNPLCDGGVDSLEIVEDERCTRNRCCWVHCDWCGVAGPTAGPTDESAIEAWNMLPRGEEITTEKITKTEYDRSTHSHPTAEKEKKTKILLDAFENIIKEMEYCGYADDCPEDCRPYGYCIFCRSKRALEEYKKE